MKIAILVGLSVVVWGAPGTAWGQLADSAWPKFHANASCTGEGPGAGVINSKLWAIPGYEVASSPAVGPDGTVYVGMGSLTSSAGAFYALNGQSGAIKWEMNTSQHVDSSPALGANGLVYFGCQNDDFYAVNASNGVVKWSFKTSAPVNASPALDGDLVFIEGGGVLYALNAATGASAWKYVTNRQSSPAVGENGLIYVASQEKSGSDTTNQVRALEETTGVLKWTYDAGLLNSDPVVGPNGEVYLARGEGLLDAVDGERGTRIWRFTAPGKLNFTTPALGSNGTLYAINANGVVYALNSKTGAQIWHHTGASGTVFVSSPALGGDGTVYAETVKGQMLSLNGETGALNWSFQFDSEKNQSYSSPAIGPNGNLYVGTYTNGIVALDSVLTLSTLSLSPTALDGGDSVETEVALFGSAPTDGAVVSLTSNLPTIVKVPSTVKIPAGKSSFGFTLATKPTQTTQKVTLTATYKGLTKSALLTVYGDSISAFALSSTSVAGGATVTGTVTLAQPAPTGGWLVMLKASSSSDVSFPASIKVSAGATKATFTISTKSFKGSAISDVFTASDALSSKSATLKISP
jgi:outer membrane protein assembly factor BamB